MKILVTVGWSIVVAVEADKNRLNDEFHLAELRRQAVKEAIQEVHERDAMITNCGEVPALEE